MINDKPVYQLRIYEIFEHNKAAFHQRFRDHAARLMRNHDFNILAMWESRNINKTEFVYLLEWPDEEVMDNQWASFMNDGEWSEIKRVTNQKNGNMVGAIEEKVMRDVAYSPFLERS